VKRTGDSHNVIFKAHTPVAADVFDTPGALGTTDRMLNDDAQSGQAAILAFLSLC
jgi:hypothetical protein